MVASRGKHVAMPSCLGCSGEPTQYPDIATATAKRYRSMIPLILTCRWVVVSMVWRHRYSNSYRDTETEVEVAVEQVRYEVVTMLLDGVVNQHNIPA